MFPACIRSRSFLVALAAIVILVFFVHQTNLLGRKSVYSGECSVDVINSVYMEQDDPCVLNIIRQKFLHPPSTLTLQLEHPETENPSMGQAQSVMNILKNKRGGFFIECGALDGETRSNTLYLERELGWEGVLIEGDPDNFKKVLLKHRKAWAVPACLSKSTRPQIVSFQQLFNQGRISQVTHKNRLGFVDVQCFPIYSILAALNRTTVDYFSLDIEGDELSILKTIPWDLIDIRTLSVEFIHDKEGKEEIRNFMAHQGYEVVTEVTHPMWLANDFIFAKKTLVPPV